LQEQGAYKVSTLVRAQICYKRSLRSTARTRDVNANKGFIRDNQSARVETQRSFFEEKASFGITRLYQNVQPSDQGRQGYRLSYDGIGFVKVSEAQVSVKEMFFQRGKASYKVRSSD
jgi:hypothetical protein